MGRIIIMLMLKGFMLQLITKAACYRLMLVVVSYNNVSENKGTRDWNVYVNQFKGENIPKEIFLWHHRNTTWKVLSNAGGKVLILLLFV